MRNVKRTMALALIGGGLLSLAGCGGAAVPTAARTDATAAVRSAHEVGAEQQPQASYYLELADEQIGHAEELIEHGRMMQAEQMLRRAEADAQLAIALTRTAAVSQQAEQSMDRIQEMRERHL